MTLLTSILPLLFTVPSLLAGSPDVALDALFRPIYRPGQPGAVVRIQKGEHLLLNRAYGQASLELGVPMKPDQVFRIGSITKTFGAVVVLQLVDEGVLELDAPVSRYLPDAPKAWERVTLAHLLSHTSGIPSFTAGPQGGYSALRAKRRTLDELIATFRDLPLQFEPGADFIYSNSGFAVLEKVLEVVTKRGFREHLTARITGPLALKHTAACDPDRVTPGLATGYTGGGRPVYPMPLDLSFMSGCMVSNAEDLARFGCALHDGRLLKPATYRRMITPFRTSNGATQDYGLGVWIRTSLGRTLVGHGGDLFGFSTELETDLGTGAIAVILQNQDKFGPATAPDVEYLSRRALAIAAGQPIAEPREVALSSDQLQALVGTYSTPTARRTLSLEGRQLFSRVDDGPAVPLCTASPSLCFVPFQETRLHFVLEQGRAVSVQRRVDGGEAGPVATRVANPGH